ncbi:FAD-dependent oxidoreductase [Natrinema versiforme]|uniref:FAD-dependent oxidoreductase n=1 Tax=Natrinema versiforme TaxID=88724 RepID=A0A4P8WND0_9EURY|nr:FAD-dependent oxidoreductase [Natrinema versiforme]QCS44964.1 FAD-dependent oxidoreductase [Natrinema versiforme]
MSIRDTEADIVIAGAGMAGLVTAVRAQQCGADVIVLEKGTRAGGSMYLSGGEVWAYDSIEEVRADIPNGDPVLQELIVESIEDGHEWLEELGVELDPIPSDIPGSGKKIEPEAFTSRMVDIVEDNESEIRLGTPVSELRTRDGKIESVVAMGSDNEPLKIETEAVVLATGGFQGNERLVEQFITEHTENLWLRANPWSTGDGLEAAVDIGAKTTKGMSKFYGHNLPAPPASISASDFREAAQYYGPMALALGVDGNRFADETDSEIEEALPQDTIKDAGGRAYYILDQDVYDSPSLAGHAGEDVELAREMDGRVAECATLDELGETITDWGGNGRQTVETIRSYNEAIREDEAHLLDPPRSDNQYTIETPPFYAVEVQPAITFTTGGLDVDSDMRVLRQSNSAANFDAGYTPLETDEMYSNSIPGLFAAGVDVGNVSNRTYQSGLGQSLVTGIIAAENAAEYAAADTKP